MNKIQDYVNTFNLGHDDGVILALIPIQDSVLTRSRVGGKISMPGTELWPIPPRLVRWWSKRQRKGAKYAHPSQLWAGPVSELRYNTPV